MSNQNNPFLAAIQSAAKKQQEQREAEIARSKVPPVPAKKVEPKPVTVDKELNTGNLVVHNLPDKFGDQLTRAGWHWQIGSQTYFTKETPEALKLLGELLDLDLGTEDNPLPEVVEPQQVQSVEPEDSEYSPEFQKYRNQVDDLLGHLKIHAADLMLLAIDTLHRETFRRN